MRKQCHCGRIKPCPDHPSIGRHGTRNDTRDITAHNRWARALKKQTPYCQRCGSTNKLDAHHADNGQGIVLCNPCHCIMDPHARPR